jgi:hypothetical protein
MGSLFIDSYFFFNILAYWVMWFLFWAGFCSFIFSHKAFSFSGNSDVGWFFYEVFPLLVCINEIFIGHESSLKPILFLRVSWFFISFVFGSFTHFALLSQWFQQLELKFGQKGKDLQRFFFCVFISYSLALIHKWGSC